MAARRSALLAVLFAFGAPVCGAAPPFAGGGPAVTPGELTVRLRIQDGDRQYPARMLPVQVELDAGVRCVKPPCPQASRSVALKSGRDASVRIPVPDWSRVLSIRVQGAKALGAPGGKAQRLADGSFLLVVESDAAEAAPP